MHNQNVTYQESNIQMDYWGGSFYLCPCENINSQKELYRTGETHMFCRAMDSRRSVMEGSDETEK